MHYPQTEVFSMKKVFLFLIVAVSAQSYAGLSEMMHIYNHPQSAPQVSQCKGDTKCNAFFALSNQLDVIPNSYRYNGFDIKKQAKQGDGYGLNKGFSLRAEQSIALSDAGDAFFYSSGKWSAKKEAIFGRGLAVLLYIEDKNGWVKD